MNPVMVLLIILAGVCVVLFLIAKAQVKRADNIQEKAESLRKALWGVELKGKPLSLGAIIAVTALVIKATISPLLDIDAAIKVAAFVVLVFAPIDVSMWMKNIFTPLANARVNYAQPYTAPQDYTAMETGGGK